MKVVSLIAATICLLSINVANANDSNKAYQLLINEKMQLLADSQRYVQEEVNRHVNRALEIQSYQVCIQRVTESAALSQCTLK